MEGILKEWLSSITEAINNLMRAEFNHARNQSRAETTALLGAAKWKLQEIEQGIKLALPSETVELEDRKSVV